MVLKPWQHHAKVVISLTNWIRTMTISRILLVSVAVLTVLSTSFAGAIELKPNDPVYVKMDEKVADNPSYERKVGDDSSSMTEAGAMTQRYYDLIDGTLGTNIMDGESGLKNLIDEIIQIEREKCKDSKTDNIINDKGDVSDSDESDSVSVSLSVSDEKHEIDNSQILQESMNIEAMTKEQAKEIDLKLSKILSNLKTRL